MPCVCELELQLHWGLNFMSLFCLHNLTLLDSVSGMPIQYIYVCGSKAAEKDEGQSQKETPGEQGFYKGFGCSCIITPNCRQSLLTSLFPLPNLILTNTRIHTLTVYVNRRWQSLLHRGEKRKYERGGDTGKGEWRIDLWNEAFQTALSACCEKHL